MERALHPGDPAFMPAAPTTPSSPPHSPWHYPLTKAVHAPHLCPTPVWWSPQQASWMHSLLRTQLRTARAPPSAWERSTISMETSSGCLVMSARSPPRPVPPPRASWPCLLLHVSVHPRAVHTRRVPLLWPGLHKCQLPALHSTCSRSEASCAPVALCLPFDGGCSRSSS